MNRKERRRAPRTNSTVPLDVYDRDGRVIIGEGRFVNVSLTGSLLESQHSFRPRQQIRLHLQSPARSPLELSGRVVWRKKHASAFSYGVEFDPISTAQVLTGQSATSYTHA